MIGCAKLRTSKTDPMGKLPRKCQVGLYLASTLPSIRPPQHSNSEKRFSTIRLGKGWARGGNGPIERERNGDPLVALASAGNGTWGTNGVSPPLNLKQKPCPNQSGPFYTCVFATMGSCARDICVLYSPVTAPPSILGHGPFIPSYPRPCVALRVVVVSGAPLSLSGC